MTMRLVCGVMIDGEEQTKSVTTVSGLDQNAAFVRTLPGIGKPFYMFNSLPGKVVGADFEEAPLVTADISENKRIIEGMLAAPPIEKIQFA